MSRVLEIKKEIETTIHGEEIFSTSYSPEGFSEDLQGWFGHGDVLDEIIDYLKPNFIIEVGTWKGASAIHMLERMKIHNKDCVIICVDTWLGSPEHRMNLKWRDDLKLKNGRPQLYEQFMYNVYSKGHSENVLPIPLPADLAATLLQNFGLLVPVIYIDGAHDEFNVSNDINNYWKLLIPGGVIVGDDYSSDWPGVVSAVENFYTTNEDDIVGGLQTKGNKWIIQKKGKLLNYPIISDTYQFCS